MNAQSMAIATYGNPNTVQKTARSAEYEVIARITSQLRKGIDGGALSFPTLAEAVIANRNIWIEFASDLRNPRNELPQNLKIKLLSLAQFTQKQTTLVLQGQDSAEVLVEINTLIMRGLSGKADIS